MVEHMTVCCDRHIRNIAESNGGTDRQVFGIWTEMGRGSTPRT